MTPSATSPASSTCSCAGWPATRGVDGSVGVFAWRPPGSLVAALSDVLDGGTGVSALADPFEARAGRSAPPGRCASSTRSACCRPPTCTSRALAELAGEASESVRLAVALAVRAPRLGHVFVDLATVRDTAAVESDEPVDLSALPWPADEWVERSSAAAGRSRRASSVAAAAAARHAAVPRPLLARGAQVAATCSARRGPYLEPCSRRDRAAVRGRATDAERDAAMLRRLEVIAGGPGTGKTTTVARIVAVLLEQAAPSAARRRWSR